MKIPIAQSFKNKKNLTGLDSNSGFIIADFLFAFVMVIGTGIFIFALTFSLATIEVAQYIVWSTARNYSAANISEVAAQQQALSKFENLTAAFPLLTGNGADSPWFRLSSESLVVGDLAELDQKLMEDLSDEDRFNLSRQPWIGASARVNLLLFASLKIPFLGPVAEDKSLFEFPVRAFILRHPSREDCQRFFYQQRFSNGIQQLENGNLEAYPGSPSTLTLSNIGGITDGFGEDNGC